MEGLGIDESCEMSASEFVGFDSKLVGGALVHDCFPKLFVRFVGWVEIYLWS